MSIARSSAAIRSALITVIWSAISTMAVRVAGSSVKLSTAACRTVQQPQLVFGEALARLADRADDAARQVVAAADKIDHAIFQRIVEQPIDREVAAQGVGFRRAELDAVGGRPPL